ncbi:MAG: SDR family oxidoreductase [Thermomonas sp.]
MSTRIALVTGANRGLGLEFVRQLLARGERVLAACRHPGKAGDLNLLAGDHPGRLHVLPLDVASEISRNAFARELALVLDDDARIDLLVNNAGVLHSGERWGEVREDVLLDTLRTNAAGPFLLAQQLAPRLADGARIANISSELGSVADAGRFGTPSYCISKAALNMACAQIAAALRERGIAVLALHPGWVRTDMGGPRATVPASESARGLLRLIDAADASEPLRLRDWRGETLPW